tara:strand:- start:110 stop:451 length:342 start_codon:yes stop_codon:yes gene_type:complete
VAIFGNHLSSLSSPLSGVQSRSLICSALSLSHLSDNLANPTLVEPTQDDSFCCPLRDLRVELVNEVNQLARCLSQLSVVHLSLQAKNQAGQTPNHIYTIANGAEQVKQKSTLF